MDSSEVLRFFQALKDWQQFWLGASDIPTFFLNHRFGVFPDLFGRFQIKIVGPILFIFAVVGRVVTTNLRSRFVDAAAIVRLQVLADGVDQQIPIVLLFENAGPVVQQKPSQVFQLLEGIGRFDGHGKIAAALGNAVFAQRLALGQFVAVDLSSAKGGGAVLRAIRGLPG